MAISGPAIKKDGEAAATNADSNPDTIDANALRRQREQAFREVRFATVAGHKVVNGYYSTMIPVGDENPDGGLSSPSSSATDSCLSTPLINMSDLSSSGSRDDDRSRQQQPLHSESRPLLVSPEAVLHRDGEQARLVEVVRRRQQQQRQQHEETTFEWLEESANQFWESILVYGGLIEDPRNDPFHRSRHSTMPLNPYRDNSRPALNNNPHEQNSNSLLSSESKTKQERPKSQLNMERPPSSPSSLSKYPRIIRYVFCTLLRALCVVRWFIDICITRLARIEPLPHDANSPLYSTSPIYSLKITADDILIFLIMLWVSFYCSSRMHIFAAPVLVIMCMLIGAVKKNAIRRGYPIEDQRQAQHQKNANQSIAKKGDAISTVVPEQLSSRKISHVTKDQLPSNAMQRLRKQHPNATDAECKRFLACVKYDEEAASNRINEFLKWRKDCGLKIIAEEEGNGSAKDGSEDIVRYDRVFDQNFVKKDEEDWDEAAKLAISIITKSHVTADAARLPQIICSYEGPVEGSIHNNSQANKSQKSAPPRCKDGTRILHILPFRIDLSLATAPTYSLAAALYIDRRFSRSTTERITLFCDVRGGRGWANPTPWSMLPFIQSTASLLGSHYPERLERLVLFPMPKSAIWVWSAAQKCLDPNTSSKVVVVSSDKDGGLPKMLIEFICEESLNTLEKRRQSFFAG